MRKAEIKRTTSETDIFLKLNIDGKGDFKIDTGCGFLDHMLQLFSRHGCFDLEIEAKGDTKVDYHHTTEDIGICLGNAFAKASGVKGGIKRYADIILPMDEALIMTAVDVSGRGGCYCSLDIPSEKVGDFDTELCEEFWNAFSKNAGITIHIRQLEGRNSHHIIEGVFKASARTLREAFSIDETLDGQVPSTKGMI